MGRAGDAGGFAALAAVLEGGRSTAFIVLRGGSLVFHWGRVSLVSSVASVRKSLVSALYGISVAEGRIDLGATLADPTFPASTRSSPGKRRAGRFSCSTSPRGGYRNSTGSSRRSVCRRMEWRCCFRPTASAGMGRRRPIMAVAC